jgi:aspartate racemase
MKTIGILGGLGPESTAAYYNYITRKYYELKHDYAYPQIIINSLSFKPVIDEKYTCAPMVAQAVQALARAGADFVVAACNSIHVVYDQVAPKASIPWVSIMSAVAEKAKAQGMRKVALLGTIFTMQGSFYRNAFDACQLDLITPDADDQRQVNRIIYDELVLGVVRPESREVVLGIIDKLGKAGAQGVILGCTELPFLIQSEHTNLPVLDSTVIHAQKALDLAIA